MNRVKSLAAALLSAALLPIASTASPVHASWYVAFADCQSLEEFAAAKNVPPAFHTPDDLIDVGIAADVSNMWASKMPAYIYRANWRMLDFGGSHGLHFLANNLPLCRVAAAAKAGDDAAVAAWARDALATNLDASAPDEQARRAAVRAAHPGPKEIPLCRPPHKMTARDGCQ